MKKLLLIASVLLVCSCAKQSAPTGGDKDIEPPIPIRSNPVNYSTNFDGKKFVIEFNEYVNIQKVSQELLVSPPINKKPTIVLRGKKMIVKINNQLQDSTTYNFNFFNSIVDNNEGNALENFQFEFSTGNRFDSVYMGGILLDSYTLKPIEGAYVMLYENFVDSTPRTTSPKHIGRTNNEGFFFIPNMIEGVDYSLFAIKDMNNNKLFDLPNEAIAFADSTFRPSFKIIELNDTIRYVEKMTENDTIFRDSIVSYAANVTTIDNVKLFMFNEEYYNQYYKASERISKKQLYISFNEKLDSNFHFKPLTDSIVSPDWCMTEGVWPTDSLIVWIKDSNIYKRDTLKLELNYTMKDSLNEDYIKTDTIKLLFENKSLKEKKFDAKQKFNNLLNVIKGEKKQDDKKETKKTSELKLELNSQKTLDLNIPIEFKFNYPIAQVSSSSIDLLEVVDTIKTPCKYEFVKVENTDRIYQLNYNFKESTNYELFIPGGTFADIYGNTNDTLINKFKTQSTDYYSTIKLRISNLKSRAVVQLYGKDKKPVKELTIEQDGEVVFDYISPAIYTLKLYNDDNGNGKWDTGNFKELRQPERVYIFRDKIDVKPGWDLSYDWELND